MIVFWNTWIKNGKDFLGDLHEGICGIHQSSKLDLGVRLGARPRGVCIDLVLCDGNEKLRSTVFRTDKLFVEQFISRENKENATNMIAGTKTELHRSVQLVRVTTHGTSKIDKVAGLKRL